MLPNIHLFGYQGSGKDTQAELIAAKLGCWKLSSGEVLRSLDGIEHQQVLQRLEHGELVPDETFLPLIGAYLAQNLQGRGLVATGLIRTTAQRAWYEQQWQGWGLSAPSAIHLLVPRELALQRAKQRGRSDDHLETTLQNRLDTFEQETVPVIEEFQRVNRCITVDGTGSIGDVFRAILEQISSLTHESH
jgi:adenylate kinase